MALSSLPRAVKNFNVYFDGESYAGRCDNAILPNLTAVVESHRAGGMNQPVEIELGTELMTMSWVLSDYDPRVLSYFSKQDVPVTLRGSVQAQGQRPEPVIINMRGLHKGIEFSQWQGGTKTTQTITTSLTYYRYRQNDVEYCEIDVLNMVQRIGGTDQLADHRTNIGL